jgi:hypothetical protein
MFEWCDGRVLDENTNASRCVGLRVQDERAELLGGRAAGAPELRGREDAATGGTRFDRGRAGGAARGDRGLRPGDLPLGHGAYQFTQQGIDQAKVKATPAKLFNGHDLTNLGRPEAAPSPRPWPIAEDDRDDPVAGA